MGNRRLISVGECGEAYVKIPRDVCRRTQDGSAYPLDSPWGNLGTTMNGMCAAGMYQTLGYDPVDSPLRKSAACFMQRQLGYIFNHKCERNLPGYSCNTNSTEGFSYMVGCALPCMHVCPSIRD